MTYAHYLSHIAAYEREFKTWEGRVEKILKRYRDDKRDRRADGAKFNVLWSNVQTLKAATFARLPMPDVSRRFKDNDPVGRVAALILERALEFQVQHYRDYGASVKQCVYDRFLGGRGTAWVRYEPTFTPPAKEEEGEQVTEDAEAATPAAEELEDENAPVDYVHWKDFGHAVTRTWEECEIIWRKVYLTEKAAEDRFPGKKLPMDTVPDEQKNLKSSAEGSSVNRRAMVYELWDKSTGKAVWLSKSLGEIIDEKPDPLGLEEFFPCPPPIYATLTTDSLVPLPDFTLYQDQANELDILSDRIDGLVKALQVKGVYDSSQPELARLFTEGENGTLIAVKNWQAFAEKQGLQGSINIVDLAPIAAALREAYLAFEQVKSQIYELTGISDILRGETAPSETATAQQIKNSYASMRLKVYQDEVERFATRLLQLKAQIICNHFDPQTIAKLACVEQLTPEDQALIGPAMAMLKQHAMRSFRIEIATDSMVYQDEQQEKQDRTELIQAVGKFMQIVPEVGQMTPALVPMAVEVLKFVITGFRVGKNIEGTIDVAIDQLKKQAAQQANAPKPPPPEAIKAQADAQIAQMKAQSDAQGVQMKAQADRQLAEFKGQQDQQLEAMKGQSAAQLAQIKAQVDQTTQDQKAEHERQLKAMELEHERQCDLAQQSFDRWKCELENTTKVMVAEIQAKASATTALVGAAASADGAEAGQAEPAEPEKPDTSVADALTAALDSFKDALGQLRAPRTIVRDADGRAQGIV